MITTTPVVHDLQFGTYSSPHTARGRHSSWPCMGGVTRSHGRRAGAWVRVGDRSFWCCLQRPVKRPRRVGTAVVDPVRPPLPADLPPARTEPPSGLARVLRRLAEGGLWVAIFVLLAVAAVSTVGLFR